MARYITQEIKDKILDEVSLETTYKEYVPDYKKSGKDLVGTCPSCNKKKLSLTIKDGDQIVKCFSCDLATKNNGADFLHKFKGIEYPDNFVELADRFNIDITQKVKKRKSIFKQGSFRDQQLRASGIKEKDQKHMIQLDSATEQESDRYQSATIDQYWQIDHKGDDMLLHYVDLDGKLMMYRRDKKKAEIPYFRVRYQNPDLHPGENGKPVKYKTPYGAGLKLWFPQRLINEYRGQKHVTYETLIITEGEKKADVLMAHDLLTVGISGIHNFGSKDGMPYQFELIIRKFEVKRVIFLVDADWQDLSIKNPEKIERRPASFARAVINYRDYFHSYINQGIELDIFWGAHKDKHFKGIDDLIVGDKKAQQAIGDEMEQAIIDRDGESTYLQLHKINTVSEYKIRGFWKINNAQEFMNHYKDTLKQLIEFRFRGQRWKYNKEEDKLEMIEKIMPFEQYWDVKMKQSGEMQYQFVHRKMKKFLYNRGIGKLALSDDAFRFIKLENKIVKEVTVDNIQDYVVAFTEQLDEPEVEELILRGGEQYIGHNRLKRLDFLNPDFLEADKNCQYLLFNELYWKIEADLISTGKIAELPCHVWRDNIIDFSPILMEKPIIKVERKNDDWEIEATEEFGKSDICRFFSNTSLFAWKKAYQLIKNEDGKYKWVLRPKSMMEPYSDEEMFEYKAHLAAKMLATGYILHQYNDFSNMRAIITMDGVESEVGKSEGGTGKSLWSTMFQKILKTFRIDGKDPKISENRFIFDGVNERTGLIVFDDLRVNFDFETWLNVITNGVPVNEKGNRAFMLDPIKIVMNTNHAVNGDGNSFLRRQYTIAFCDYYNAHRTPEDDFGRLMFRDWEFEQWNYYFNFVATCIQLKLKYQLDYTIPQEDVIRRKLRQNIGEDFMTWASEHYDPASDYTWLNNQVEKMYMYDIFVKERRNAAKFVDVRRFKSKIVKYAEYAGLQFNPEQKGGRIMSSNQEFFVLADDNFNTITKIQYP